MHENIWAKWALSSEELRELFVSMKTNNCVDDEEFYDDDEDCIYD